MNKLAVRQCILNPSVMRHKIRRGYKEMYVLIEKLIESKCSNRICSLKQTQKLTRLEILSSKFYRTVIAFPGETCAKCYLTTLCNC